MSMNIGSAGYTNAYEAAKRDWKDGYGSRTDAKRRSEAREEAEAAKSAGRISGANEAKLSSRAQKYLDQLREKYNDYDFFLGNSTDDLKSLSKSGSKEISVIFSNAELERMATDEKYATEKLHMVERAVAMSDEINKKFGFERALGKGSAADTQITKLGIAFDDNGTAKYFAELEKTGANQKERIDKIRAEKRTEKKEAASGKDLWSYQKGSADTKRTTVWADSMEELVDEMSTVNWNHVTAENGSRYDFSV